MNEEDNKRLGRLIFALACGNISVLDEIYQMLAKLLYAVGNIYYSQRADIEDAIQDLLILLYQNARKCKENKNACAWGDTNLSEYDPQSLASATNRRYISFGTSHLAKPYCQGRQFKIY